MAAQIPVAFLAGLVSVLTPCVLPLVPGYLSTVSAVEVERLGESGVTRRIVAATVPFILGFTVIFVALGAGAAAVGNVVGSDAQNAIAGFFLVVAGLGFAGLLPLPERIAAPGLLVGARRRGSAALLGGAFAVCAAPCIGPVLGAALATALHGSVAKGVVLLTAYSAGLGFAFLLAGLAFGRAMTAFRFLRDHYNWIRYPSAAILIALGLLLFFGRDWWIHVALNRALEAIGLGSI